LVTNIVIYRRQKIPILTTILALLVALIITTIQINKQIKAREQHPDVLQAQLKEKEKMNQQNPEDDGDAS